MNWKALAFFAVGICGGIMTGKYDEGTPPVSDRPETVAPLPVSEAEPLSDCECSESKKSQCRTQNMACCATKLQDGCRIYCGTACLIP